MEEIQQKCMELEMKGIKPGLCIVGSQYMKKIIQYMNDTVIMSGRGTTSKEAGVIDKVMVLAVGGYILTIVESGDSDKCFLYGDSLVSDL